MQRFPCTGRVLAVSRLQLEVELPFKPGRLQDQTWRLEKLGSMVTYERCIAALKKLASLSSLKRGYRMRTQQLSLCTIPLCPCCPPNCCAVPAPSLSVSHCLLACAPVTASP